MSLVNSPLWLPPGTMPLFISAVLTVLYWPPSNLCAAPEDHCAGKQSPHPQLKAKSEELAVAGSLAVLPISTTFPQSCFAMTVHFHIHMQQKGILRPRSLALIQVFVGAVFVLLYFINLGVTS